MSRTVKIGIHENIPESVYRSLPCVCNSDLGHVCNGRTLAHAREAILHPKEPTPAMVLGTQVHHAVLQPDIFEQEYVASIKVDRRTKDGKKKWKDFEMTHAGKEIIEKDDYDHCLAMRDAVWTNPLMAEILGGQRYVEICAVWIDPETELLCKSRIDCLTTFDGFTVIADLKTCADASPYGFAKSVANYGYHRQNAFYIDGLNALAPRDRMFYFLAVEKSPPYCSAVYRLDYESVEKGRREYRDAITRWKEATETGVWPGYPTEIQTLELPRWAMSYSEEETI